MYGTHSSKDTENVHSIIQIVKIEIVFRMGYTLHTPKRKRDMRNMSQIKTAVFVVHSNKVEIKYSLDCHFREKRVFYLFGFSEQHTHEKLSNIVNVFATHIHASNVNLLLLNYKLLFPYFVCLSICMPEKEEGRRRLYEIASSSKNTKLSNQKTGKYVQ